MDLNRLNNPRVVSPQSETRVQPQILEDTSNGLFPAGLRFDRKRVTDLLLGKVESMDAQSGVYHILLTAECERMSKEMPFLFDGVDVHTAMQSRTFMDMGTAEKRKQTSGVKLLALYHNEIDDVGDKQLTELDTFKAVDSAMNTLTELVKHLLNACNFTSVIITADHGFLYQQAAVDETDFPVCDLPEDKITKKGARYVLGTDLESVPVSKGKTERTLLAGFYSEDDTLISEEISLTFNLSSQEARSRQIKQVFRFTPQAADCNGQTIRL